MDEWQVRFLRSVAPKITLNCARQSGKSTAASALAIAVSLYRPPSLTLLVSPNLRTSGELMKKCLWFWRRLDGGARPKQESALSLTLANGSRVVSLPGSEVSARGWSPNLVVLDEAARCDPELYFALRPALAATRGRLILMSTPAGKLGFFHDEWHGDGEWERIEIPATSCSRITAEFLAEERRTMPPWRFAQEYECQFVDNETTVFGADLIARMTAGGAKRLFDRPIDWSAA